MGQGGNSKLNIKHLQNGTNPIDGTFLTNDNMIYSRDNKTVVNLDDFDLLKVVGKGNFAKVL